MEPVTATFYTDTQRMELRGLIRLSSEVNLQWWAVASMSQVPAEPRSFGWIR